MTTTNDELAQFAKRLADAQTPMDADIAKTLRENWFKLFDDTTNPAAADGAKLFSDNQILDKVANLRMAREHETADMLISLIERLSVARHDTASAPDWRPIETAPDRAIVANCSHGKAHWAELGVRGKGVMRGCWYTPQGKSIPTVTHWTPEPDKPASAPNDAGASEFTEDMRQEMMQDLFKRQSDCIEWLQDIARRKLPIPTQEECRKQAVKLGKCERYRAEHFAQNDKIRQKLIDLGWTPPAAGAAHD